MSLPLLRVAKSCATTIVGVLLLAAVAPGATPQAKDPPPASLQVTGTGWLRDRELKLALERLLGDARGAVLNANAVEDVMFLLISAVQSEGFLHPVIAVECLEADGRRVESTLDADLTATVPRHLQAHAVRFRVQPGVRYYIDAATFTGLHVLPTKTAQSFFTGSSTLLALKSGRAYTPARLARAIDAVQAEIRLLGYAEAEVRTKTLALDDRSGAVAVVMEVREGPRWRVASVAFEGTAGTGLATDLGAPFVGRPWTELLQHDIAGHTRRALYRHGYADARVRVSRVASETLNDHRDVAVSVLVRPGEIVHLGAVRFEGAVHVRDSVLQRRIEIRAGAPLDPLAIDQSRYRLARLGVFDRVDLRYEPTTGPVRSPLFQLREGRSLETNLLLGYGSYEQARGAVELRHFNILGRAHQSRLLLAQSMKSTRAEYAYTVPEIFGESVDGTAKLFGLQRDELAFQRREYGANLVLSMPLAQLGAQATAGYTFQRLGNRDSELASRTIDDRQVTVASLDVGITCDRRDNPLRPRSGHRWFAQLEAASRELGGEAEFQRLELGASHHFGWRDGRWVHAALAHGVITTWGTSDRRLPVNTRFFPGGGSSIRGFREGEASPRGADGRFTGAKTYTLANLDLEQALTSTWSVVVFGDALVTAAELRQYPLAGERLYSAGLGVRYQTLIGPIRVEYGRNLNPRPGDPRGTWQISVGAAF